VSCCISDAGYKLLYSYLLCLLTYLLHRGAGLPLTANAVWPYQCSFRPWKVLEGPGIKTLRFLGLESPGKKA